MVKIGYPLSRRSKAGDANGRIRTLRLAPGLGAGLGAGETSLESSRAGRWGLKSGGREGQEVTGPSPSRASAAEARRARIAGSRSANLGAGDRRVSGSAAGRFAQPPAKAMAPPARSRGKMHSSHLCELSQNSRRQNYTRGRLQHRLWPISAEPYGVRMRTRRLPGPVELISTASDFPLPRASMFCQKIPTSSAVISKPGGKGTGAEPEQALWRGALTAREIVEFDLAPDLPSSLELNPPNFSEGCVRRQLSRGVDLSGGS